MHSRLGSYLQMHMPSVRSCTVMQREGTFSCDVEPILVDAP
jgi:hypothetical protein